MSISRIKKDSYTSFIVKYFCLENYKEGLHMSRNYYNINLTKLELGNIEFYLNNRKNFTIIGKILNKDESTIRKRGKKIFFVFW